MWNFILSVSLFKKHCYFRLMEQFPYTSIPVCSLAECTLQQLHQDGSILYQRGDSEFTVIKSVLPDMERDLQFVQNILNM